MDEDSWTLLPLARRETSGTSFVGPVWWGPKASGVFPLYWRDKDSWTGFPLLWKRKDAFTVFPLYWQTPGGWTLFPLAWDWNERGKGVGPVWWGDDYLDLFPFYWSHDKDWLLMPLAWHTRNQTGIGPVWWGVDYLHVFPLYWSHGEDWTLFPIAGQNTGGVDWAGPLWRNHAGGSGFFPFFWKRPQGWTLFPLAWNYEKGSTGIGPVWWDQRRFGVAPLYWQNEAEWTLFPVLFKRPDSFTVFPFYYQRQKAHHVDRILFPVAWNTTTSTGVGPIWKTGDAFRIFPLFWKKGDDWTVPPLAWHWKDSQGLLPVYWNWKGRDQASRTIIPPLLAWSETTADSRQFHAVLGMINSSRDRTGRTFEFQPFVKTRSGETSHFSIFWRLFEYHRDPEESFYRVLFIPAKIGATHR
jgi:hypothetical protein